MMFPVQYFFSLFNPFVDVFTMTCFQVIQVFRQSFSMNWKFDLMKVSWPLLCLSIFISIGRISSALCRSIDKCNDVRTGIISPRFAVLHACTLDVFIEI